VRCKAALGRRRRGRPREKEAVLMLAAAAAAATAAASATAAAASAICRPACVDAADGKRAVHPVPESDIRELRKKLKPHVSRPVDPVLQRTPSERFPCWSEGSAGIDAASIVCSSSRALGSGSYGSVEPVTTLDRPGQRLAMKIVSAKSIGSDSSASDSSASDRVKEALSDAARELKLLQDNESPFLMTAVGGGGVVLHSTNGTLAASSCPEQHVGVAMLMEEMAGDLSNRVLKMGALPDAHCQFYVASILLGLEDLHSRGILHRDIKIENVLIGQDGYVRIADFGLSKTCETVENLSFHGVCGTAEYFAPEIACLTADEVKVGTRYSKAVDLWAAGVLTYYLLEGYLPFEASSESDPDDEVDWQILAYCSQTNPLPWTQSTPAARNFVEGLLQKQEDSRLGMVSQGGYVALRKHTWFHGFDWNALMSGEMEAPWVPDSVGTDAKPHQREE
jgi:serine/threonine protein kinase